MVHLPQLECPYSYLTTSSQMWGHLIPKTIWMLVPQGKLCWPTQGKRGQRSCMKHYSPSERMYQKGGWDMSIKWQAPVAKICLTSVVCLGYFFPSCPCSILGHSLWPDTFFHWLPRRQIHLHRMWHPGHRGSLPAARIRVLPVSVWGQPTSVAPEEQRPFPEAFGWTFCQVSSASIHNLSGPIHGEYPLEVIPLPNDGLKKKMIANSWFQQSNLASRPLESSAGSWNSLLVSIKASLDPPPSLPPF